MERIRGQSASELRNLCSKLINQLVLHLKTNTPYQLLQAPPDDKNWRMEPPFLAPSFTPATHHLRILADNTFHPLLGRRLGTPAQHTPYAVDKITARQRSTWPRPPRDVELVNQPTPPINSPVSKLSAGPAAELLQLSMEIRLVNTSWSPSSSIYSLQCGSRRSFCA